MVVFVFFASLIWDLFRKKHQFKHPPHGMGSGTAENIGIGLENFMREAADKRTRLHKVFGKAYFECSVTTTDGFGLFCLTN
jgi:hypothetical protein